jgi:hypothetical protein
VVGEGRKEERLKVVVVTTILIDIEFAGVSDAAVVITGICMKPARVVRRARACLYFIGVISQGHYQYLLALTSTGGQLWFNLSSAGRCLFHVLSGHVRLDISISMIMRSLGLTPFKSKLTSMERE